MTASMQSKKIVSLMSGTSVDSIDALFVRINPDWSHEILASHSSAYPPEIRRAILNAAENDARTSDVCCLNFIVGERFARCVNELLAKNGLSGGDVDFIASHGQTIYHIPTAIDFYGTPTRGTLQIGDISVVSALTGILTIGDFRTKDMAVGGQGAPLVSFVDELLFKKPDVSRGVLNIGGISNITVVSPRCETFAFDVGPGNMLIDYFAQKLFDVEFDRGGRIAAQGKVDEDWLRTLLSEPYFKREPPKTTGRELFSRDYAERAYRTAPKKNEDVLATTTFLTAKAIGDACRNFVEPKTGRLDEIILGGGGAFNETLVRFLKSETPGVAISSHRKYGIDDKLKESLAFAYLGYCAYYQKANNLPSCTGASRPVVMGKFSY